ncbi:hypothetical protein HY495_00240 [Candidatus Woesearchaeota archaeon]|nr:hypothetical protein [Candidatus Woesearchaeota archaeon]
MADSEENNLLKAFREFEYGLIDARYRAETGGTSMEDTINLYGVLTGLAGLVVGAVAGAYVANETMEWLASDTPIGVRYTVDGLAAGVSGRYAGRGAAKVGVNLGLQKIKRVLRQKSASEE